MHCHVYILILISLFSHTFADVEFVTKPPAKVRAFPGQNVMLPCVLENLLERYHIVQWVELKSYELYKNISNNREILIQNIENLGNFAILGDDMNFTLLINIAVPEFENNNNIVKHNVGCFVVDPIVNKVVLSSTSEISIQKWKFIAPVCGNIKTYYVIGETLTLGCYNDPDPTIITTLKSGNEEVLPTKFNGSHIIHNLIVTKKDHGEIFEFKSRRNGKTEIKSCSIGPITVNFKPEINITQTSALEFKCTAEARPPVKETHWIMEPSIPQDRFTISYGVLRIIEPLKVESEMKITCEAENTIGKGNKTLSIPTVNNRDEEDGSSIIPTVNNRDEENGSSIIPTVNSRDEEDGTNIIPAVNNQDEDDGFESTLVIIVVICVLFCVVVAFIIILLFLRRKRIKHQHSSKSRNTSARFRSSDDPQVEIKNEDPKGLVYDYAAIDVNEFRADYQKNEMNIDGDVLSNDETNVRDNVNRASTDCEKLKNEQQVYSQVNKPDYKVCENEIYQGCE